MKVGELHWTPYGLTKLKAHLCLAMDSDFIYYLDDYGNTCSMKRKRPVLRIIKTLTAIPLSILFGIFIVIIGPFILSHDAYKNDRWIWE